MISREFRWMKESNDEIRRALVETQTIELALRRIFMSKEYDERIMRVLAEYIKLKMFKEERK